MHSVDPEDSGKCRIDASISIGLGCLRRSPSKHPMVQRTYPSIRIPTTTRWPGAFPVRQHAFRRPPAVTPPTRPIATSPVHMGWARSRVSGICQRPLVIIREVERKSGLPVRTFFVGAILAILGEMARVFLSPRFSNGQLGGLQVWGGTTCTSRFSGPLR